jgi:hypothetical protein
MAKKQRASASELLSEMLKLHIPEDYLHYFELHEVHTKKDCYELVLHEKEECLPKELKGTDAVLDGFCNPLSVLSHAFSLKKIYLIIMRRRWKLPGTDKHYSNEYDLYPEGAKITRDFAFFFEGLYRRASGES